MAFSQDSDLVDLIPDILSLGITSFTDDHAKAQSDIERELRIKWWPKKGIAGEMENSTRGSACIASRDPSAKSTIASRSVNA